MKGHNLSIETLKDLDSGRAAEAFNTTLRRAVQDCVARPADDRVRKVILQCELTPQVGGDEVEVSFQVTDKIPSFQTHSVKMSVRKQSGQLQLVFGTEEDEEAA